MKISKIHLRLASRICFALLLASVFGLTGCISRPALNKQTFTFNAPAISATNVVAGDRVLGIRSLQIAAPFEGRSLVYRTGEFSYVRDPYAEFLEPSYSKLFMKPDSGPKMSTQEFKTSVRRRLTDQGFTIIANVGDQEVDLLGGYSEQIFKIPNPFYIAN